MKNPNLYVVLWEFHVKSKWKKKFERLYGPEGIWARFFRREKGYLGTELLGDAEQAHRYVTFDFWVSRAAYKFFRRQWKNEYEVIDEACKALTTREKALGAFLWKRGAKKLGRIFPT